ncbi:MAG: hypothetical protein MHPSP_000096 [Paramarteilia canceri]
MNCHSAGLLSRRFEFTDKEISLEYFYAPNYTTTIDELYSPACCLGLRDFVEYQLDRYKDQLYEIAENNQRAKVENIALESKNITKELNPDSLKAKHQNIEHKKSLKSHMELNKSQESQQNSTLNIKGENFGGKFIDIKYRRSFKKIENGLLCILKEEFEKKSKISSSLSLLTDHALLIKNAKNNFSISLFGSGNIFIQILDETYSVEIKNWKFLFKKTQPNHLILEDLTTNKKSVVFDNGVLGDWENLLYRPDGKVFKPDLESPQNIDEVKQLFFTSKCEKRQIVLTETSLGLIIGEIEDCLMLKYKHGVNLMIKKNSIVKFIFEGLPIINFDIPTQQWSLEVNNTTKINMSMNSFSISYPEKNDFITYSDKGLIFKHGTMPNFIQNDITNNENFDNLAENEANCNNKTVSSIIFAKAKCLPSNDARYSQVSSSSYSKIDTSQNIERKELTSSINLAQLLENSTSSNSGSNLNIDNQCCSICQVTITLKNAPKSNRKSSKELFLFEKKPSNVDKKMKEETTVERKQTYSLNHQSRDQDLMVNKNNLSKVNDDTYNNHLKGSKCTINSIQVIDTQIKEVLFSFSISDILGRLYRVSYNQVGKN